MWPWKSESSKECVTTHQPNALAPKMDDAKAIGRYLAVGASTAPTSRKAWRLAAKPLGAILGGAASSADLGGSSKYSNEIFED